MRDSRRRIRCLHFGQELKMPVDGNVPTHGHARRRWNGAVLFAENPRRPGTTNGGGSFPSRLKGAEPSPSAPFFRRRGAAIAGVAQGRWPLPGSAPRALGLCYHPLFSHASARIPVTISNLSPPILRPRPRPLPTRAATQRFTLLISRLLVNYANPECRTTPFFHHPPSRLRSSAPPRCYLRHPFD